MKSFLGSWAKWGVGVAVVGYLVAGAPGSQQFANTYMGGSGAIAGSLIGGGSSFKAGFESTAPNSGTLGGVAPQPAPAPDQSSTVPAGVPAP